LQLSETSKFTDQFTKNALASGDPWRPIPNTPMILLFIPDNNIQQQRRMLKKQAEQKSCNFPTDTSDFRQNSDQQLQISDTSSIFQYCP